MSAIRLPLVLGEDTADAGWRARLAPDIDVRPLYWDGDPAAARAALEEILADWPADRPYVLAGLADAARAVPELAAGAARGPGRVLLCPSGELADPPAEPVDAAVTVLWPRDVPDGAALTWKAAARGEFAVRLVEPEGFPWTPPVFTVRDELRV
ncbi:hypothetical protein ACFY4C_03685 [Actinomadura viridis]|uniref:hypothetical protein n=1 Tax=Actinomadura viridis TaxID=58110 RepID=UPI0036BA9261